MAAAAAAPDWWSALELPGAAALEEAGAGSLELWLSGSDVSAAVAAGSASVDAGPALLLQLQLPPESDAEPPEPAPAQRCLDAAHQAGCIRCAGAGPAARRAAAHARRARRCMPAPRAADERLFKLVGDPGKARRMRTCGPAAGLRRAALRARLTRAAPRRAAEKRREEGTPRRRAPPRRAAPPWPSIPRPGTPDAPQQWPQRPTRPQR
jgi:hypothetical protein